MNGNELSAYNSLQFIIKNEINVSSFNSQMHPIIVGEAQIPINLIKNKENDKVFEGLLEVKLRNITSIGFLKLKIQVEDENSTEIINSICKRKLLEDMEVLYYYIYERIQMISEDF